MSFCTNCGNEMPDNAKFCSKCGASMNGDATTVPNYGYTPQPTPVQGYGYQQYQKPESKALAICSIVFAVFFPLVGLICGIIGMSTYKDETNRKMSIIGLVISVVIIIIYIILWIVCMNYVFSFFNPYFWADALGY